jgi:hypothetical protein
MTAFENDPFGSIKNDKKPASPEPREVNLFHARSDRDSSWSAQHHTIGIEHNQTSAGDHSHDGVGSRKVGYGMSLTVETGVSTAADLAALLVMLHKVIEFTET